MPLIEVEIVAAEDFGQDLAQELADAFGEVFGSEPGHAWVRVRRLPRADFAENQSAGWSNASPVFVTVLEGHRPSGNALSDRASRLAEATAGVIGRPADSIHVVYLESGEGRVAFGGKLGQ